MNFRFRSRTVPDGGIPCIPGQRITQRRVPWVLNALPKGIEPDKSSPRTVVGVAVHMQTALVRCASGARDQTVAPPHAGSGWLSSPTRTVSGPA